MHVRKRPTSYHIENPVNRGYTWPCPANVHVGHFSPGVLKDRYLKSCLEKERSDSFNDALNTFYLRLYDVRHMVKDHSDSKRGNPLPPHGLLFPISSKGSFICIMHRQDNTYHASRGALGGMRNSSMGPPHEGSIRLPIAPWVNALTTELHLAPSHV